MTERLVFVLWRLPQLSREEFQHYWWNTHAPLVAARAEVLGIRKYQQVHTVRAARANQLEEPDGIAELWLDGPAPSGTPEQRRDAGADLLADERNFIDLARSPIWMAEEHPFWGSPNEGLRLTAALRRLAHVSRAEFRRHWSEHHADLAHANNDVLGFHSYTQLHTPDDAESFPLRAARGAPEPFDGMSVIWSEDVHPSEARNAEGRGAIRADEELFLDRSRSILFLSEERVVVDRIG